MSAPKVNEVLADATIRYSQVWEDERVLRQGLRTGPGDHVLSIASAGCNSLAILLDDVESVVSVDLNPAQIAICELKRAVIMRCDYDAYLAVMGVRDPSSARKILAKVQSDLSPASRNFWQSAGDVLDAGLIHTGKLDQYFRMFQSQFVEPHVPKEMLRAYLNAHNATEQAGFFDRVFRHPEFVKSFKHYTGAKMIASSGRDPAQFAYVENEDTGDYFYDRFEHVCVRVPALHNFYLEYLLTGAYDDLNHGPPQYRPDAYDKLKQRMVRWEIRTENIVDTAGSFPRHHFSKANFSDLFEYLSEEDCRDIFQVMAGVMRPGGRMAYWNLLVPRAATMLGVQGLQSQDAEAKELWNEDRCFFYSKLIIDEIAAS